MKRKSITVKILILITVVIPIIIYILSNYVDKSSFQGIVDKVIKKVGISDKSVIYNSIEEVERRDYYSIGTTGDYTWGSFEKVYSNWAEPYTVTQEQYGKNDPRVGYCCYLGWPTIKSANSSYLEDLDTMGTDHEFPSWATSKHRMAIANNDGHRQRIECINEATFTNLAKTIAYAKSGLNGAYTNGDIQNLVWNSYIWANSPYNADPVLQGTLSSGTQIDTIGGVVFHFEGDANVPRLVRAQQFATWAYQVIGNDHTLNLKLTPNKELEEEKDSGKNIHVEADQSTLSYLVGPYKLDLTLTAGGGVVNDEITAAGTGKQTLGDFLYKEIIGKNYAQTVSNSFIQTRFIIHAEYTDGTKDDVEVKRANGLIAQQTNASNRIVITDSNGIALPYGIPEFGKEFYIKYYLTEDLAKNHTLKYIQPEIKAHYIDDAMTAGGVRARSEKVSYSVHYSLCNYEDYAVFNYVKAKGYDQNCLEEGDYGGQLYQAFLYGKNHQSMTANVQDGIDGLKEMVAASNHGGDAKVTWYDDTFGGWDGIEQFYGDETERCDGVYLDETDAVGPGDETLTHFFECEYDTVDDFYESCINNYYYTVVISSSENQGVTATNTEYTHQELSLGPNRGVKIKKDYFNNYKEGFTVTECGCSDTGDCTCGCGCLGDDSCDCDDDEDSDCDCECDCDYYYDEVTLTLTPVNFCRDKRSPWRLQVIKSILPHSGGATYIRHTIPKSSATYSSESDAIAALTTAINAYLDTFFTQAVAEFKVWYYQHAYPALYVPFAMEAHAYAMPFVEETQSEMQKVVHHVQQINASGWKDNDYKLTKKEINEYLGGNVSEDKQGIESKNNYQVNNVWQGSGIEVTLVDLGIKGAAAEPQPPTAPSYTQFNPIEPVSPLEPIYVPEPSYTQAYELVTDSQAQTGSQSAMFAICNLLRSAGYKSIRAEEVVQWMCDNHFYEYSGGTMMNPTVESKLPTRENCIQFAAWYMTQHQPNTGTSNMQVNVFTNLETGSGQPEYIDEYYIIRHLPREVNGKVVWEPEKTYSAVQAFYRGNNPELSNSSSRYVVINKFREVSGRIEVYILNSGTGNHSSKWVSWSDISMIFSEAGHGQASNGFNIYSPNDYGHIEITYKVENITSSLPMSQDQFNDLHQLWLIRKNEYFSIYRDYIDALKSYNEAINDYNKHHNPIPSSVKNNYNSALHAYNSATSHWRATDIGAEGNGNGDANYTDAQARYTVAKVAYELYLSIYNNAVYIEETAEDEYESAYQQYLDDYENYEHAHGVWEAQGAHYYDPRIVYITVTDKNGNYGFQRLNPMHTYQIQFRYDGLEYIAELENPTATNGITDISDKIKNRITAYELSRNDGNINNKARGREEVNDFFKDIDASNTNYTGQHGETKAYGWYTKLRTDDASFITYADYKLEDKAPSGGTTDDNNVGAFRFVDAYDRFKQKAIEDRATKGLKDIDSSSIQKVVDTYDDIEKTSKKITYEHVIYDLLRPDLVHKGVGQNVSENNVEHDDKIGDPYDESEQVCNYIYDSLVTAVTQHSFPDDSASKFFLEDIGTSSKANSDGNNRNDNNEDHHSNYNSIVADNPFNASSTRRVNSLYNNGTSNNAQTINNRDQARNVDFTFKRRDEANLVIGMDIEAVTLLINGQKETYRYGDLGLNGDSVNELARISYRAKTDNNKSNLLNYNKNYSRVITESMYLYDGNFVDPDNGAARDLSMFITYKIVIKNTGKVDMDVGYIVDHYDSYYLQWKQEDQARIKAIVDNDEYFTAEVTENKDANHVHGNYYYDSDKQKLAAGNIDNMYNEVFIKVGKLNANDSKTMTITFEQQKDKYGRIKVNQDLQTGKLLVGDKNIVEINGYSTKDNNIFQKGLITRLSNVGNLCPEDFYDMTSADKNKAGSLIDDYATPTVNRVEVDTANAPNLVIYIPSKGYVPCISGYVFEDVRSESEQKALIGNGKYNTGDKDKKGSSDPDKKIQGVTVQLVELVRQLDENGLRPKDENDTYIKEKIWDTTEYDLDPLGYDARRATETSNDAKVPDNTVNDSKVYRYYSGTDSARIILDVHGDNYLSVKDKKDENDKKYTALTADEGMYKFVNVPPGLFVVRFIYGDTTQTVLVKNNGTEVANEVNKLIPNTSISTIDPNSEINYEYNNVGPENEQYMFLKGDSDGFVGYQGLNSKSYNGNDYKSTVYQNDTSLNVDGSYEGINVYKDYNKQNYTNEDGINMTIIKDADLLSKLYYYDIKKADEAEKTDHTDSVSDAKDVYAFRQNSDNYAKGYISTLEPTLKAEQQKAQAEIFNDDGSGENPITLRNYRNEIMNSFYQLGTYTASNQKPATVNDNKDTLENSTQQANRQVKMLQELMKYTRMVAQTGVIDFEIEYTVENWASTIGSDGESGYVEVTQLNNDTPDHLNLPRSDYVKDSREKHYHIRDLNLGLVERPEAQIRLNKDVTNIKIQLSSGEALFDTNKSVNNLYYAFHKEHTYKYKDYRLQSVKVTTNSLTTPELIQAYMDDELIENATLELTYSYTIENVGEVDYLDKKFYYTGKEDNPGDMTNVSRTNIDEVLDYVSNKINFNESMTNSLDELRVVNDPKTTLKPEYQKANWQVKSIIPEGGTAGSIVDSKTYYEGYIYPFGVTEDDAKREQTPIGGSTPASLSNAYLWGASQSTNQNADLVNREYFDRVFSYSQGSIVTTDRLSTKKYLNDNYYSKQLSRGDGDYAITYGLLPKAYNSNNNNQKDYKIQTPIILSVTMSQNEDLVFPNLVEAVRVSNSVGRRCTYSTVGNQPMANQSYGDDVSSEEKVDTLLDKYSTYNPIDVVTPIEIDADSSQSVRILPPTGFNKNNSNLYFALIGGLSIIVFSILIIKTLFMQRKKNKVSNIRRWK